MSVLLFCYYIFSAGFMTWEIAHNIDSLLVKDDRKIGAGFDLTVNANEEDSNLDLAECVRGMCKVIFKKSVNTVNSRFNADTLLLRTPHFYGQQLKSRRIRNY